MRLLAAIAVLASLACAARGDVAIDSLRATVRVHAGERSGTGFVVEVPAPAASATRLLVSAAHVFENTPGDACTVVFRGGPAQGGGRREVRLPIRAGGRPLWLRHPDADVAVIAIQPPADVDLAAFPLARLADGAAFDHGDVAVGQRVWVACFPATTEANPAGWPVLRQGTIATHPLKPIADVKTFFVDYAHFGGDSGSAVVVEREGRPLVAGVVVSMQRQTDRVKSPFEEKTVHTPLGLAIVVPSDRVIQTIDRWRAQDERKPEAEAATPVTPPAR